MSTVQKGDRRVLITGAAGFIGSALAPALRAQGCRVAGLDLVATREDYRGDIRERALLARIGHEFRPEVVVHLAAVREVVTPWSGVGELFSTNVDGAYQVLDVLRPELFVLASTSSVYGDGAPPYTQPRWDRIAPKSAYGISKASDELLCDMWARETGHSAVALRMGNLIGTSHGLLAYLVAHALRFPDGSEPARLRGGGRLVRDYIPLGHVIGCFLSSIRRQWEPGLHTVNVASGLGIANGEMFAVAQDELSRLGLRIEAQWSPHGGAYEADSIVLDPESMEKELGIARPGRDEILGAIREALAAAVRSRAAQCQKA